ncbi:MAG TPA: alpha/beta hydrolase [Burkholderiales bacterium]|nr:alpha/beta hydrolase [Burkholderiales bacterium]
MRDIEELAIFMLPGFGGSGDEHWQTAWEKAFPGFRRVEQVDWDHPVYAEWAARLSEAVTQSARPIVLVAHSLGTSLVMRWTFDQPALARKVAGAFLVAPTDRDRFEGASDLPIHGFGRMILERFPFASVVMASRDDDRVSFERAQVFARAWGSTLVDAGNQGHMGTAARLGVWPLGLFWFGQFVASLQQR